MAICPPRSMLCCILATLLSISTLSAQNTPAGGALLSANGIVTVNGDLVKDSSAISDNDTVSTGPDSLAHITSPGSNTLLASESIAAYSHDSIRLTSGAISIATSGGMYAQVHKLKFAPANQGALTKYEVRIDGCEVIVFARTGRVSLPDGKILDEGASHQSTDRDCATAKLKPFPAPGAALSGLSPGTWAAVVGGTAAAGATAAALALKSGGAPPLSPARP
jgi:hypothetical protein